MVLIKATALAAVAYLLPYATAHSWIEQMMVINGQGSFTGTPGYARNATARTTPGFSDPLMVHILPGQGQPSIEERDVSIGVNDTAGITATDPMCKKTQQSQVQGSGLPRLSAAPGSLVALRYQENGHVTLPQNQPGKPPNRGTVYIYGTSQPKSNENFLDVFNKWNADGTGGDKRGVLLAAQPYDDGQCYQVNSGSISQARQKQFAHPPDQLMGADLWCQNDIKIPSDTVSGKPYTLYWVWDWPTAPGVDPNLPNGKSEIYTTCMDVDITATSRKRGEVKARSPEPQASGNAAINSAAIPAYMSSITASAASAPATSAPAASSAPAPTSAAPPAASAPAASAKAPTPGTAMNPSLAASIVEEALGPEISSLVAAKAGGTTVTVTPQEKTVTVTANTETSPASSAPPKSSSAPPATTSAAAASSVQPASVAATPPSSINIQSPVYAASSAHSATAASSVAPASSLSLSAAFSGTAYPASVASSAAASSAAPTASASSYAKCKKAKRSRILGRAA